jgi:hypothetical protein
MSDINFDELVEQEELVEQQSTKKAKKSKASKHDQEPSKQKNKFSFGRFFLATLVPVVVASAVFFVAGTLVGSASKAKQVSTNQVVEVNKVQTLKDIIKDSKDSQIKALQTQLANMPTNLKNTTTTVDNDTLKLITTFGQINQDVIGRLNPLFEKLVSIKRFANDAELDLIKKDLEQYVDTSANPNLIYEMLSGDSVAKDVDSDLVMVGSVTSSLIGSTEDHNYVYLNIVPCVNEAKKNVNAIYLTTLQDNKCINLTYVGYIYDKNIQSFYNKYNDLLNKAASKARAEGGQADGQQN